VARRGCVQPPGHGIPLLGAFEFPIAAILNHRGLAFVQGSRGFSIPGRLGDRDQRESLPISFSIRSVSGPWRDRARPASPESLTCSSPAASADGRESDVARRQGPGRLDGHADVARELFVALTGQLRLQRQAARDPRVAVDLAAYIVALMLRPCTRAGGPRPRDRTGSGYAAASCLSSR